MLAAGILFSCGNTKTVKTEDKKDVAEVTSLSKTFAVDVSASTLGWTGKKVTKQHNGTIGIKSGSISVENDQIKAGKFIVDMTTIRNIDLTDAGANTNLVGHLSSPDFFDVQRYQESRFEITSAEKLAQPDSAGNNYNIMGNLTIKDVTKNITIPAVVTMDSTKFTAVSKFSIDRSEWNVQYGSGKFFKGLGDNLIDDIISFDLDLRAVPENK